MSKMNFKKDTASYSSFLIHSLPAILLTSVLCRPASYLKIYRNENPVPLDILKKFSGENAFK